jgi:Protein of unknown function (DUF1329)
LAPPFGSDSIEPRQLTSPRARIMRRPPVARLALVLLLLAVGRAPAGTAPPPAGGTASDQTDVLGPQTWQRARGLMPEEFLAAYRRGDYRHRIAHYNLDLLGDDPVFRAAIEANKGRYDLSTDGTIIAKTTGKPPDYVYGWPFPTIDPSDPKAAAKIVWNYYYTLYYGGNAHYRADLVWLNRSGIDRSIAVDAKMKHYDGQHPRFRERTNPLGLLTQSLDAVLSPADVGGIVSLSWRYRDAHKRDSIWTYVPALRRVRQVSPANRSDGFLGSDMTQDDGPFFDGKVQDFRWKLIGKQDLLVPFDRPSFEERPKLQRLPGGGWRMLIPARPRLGAEVPGWKGAPWCPIQEVLIRRPTWVVEAVPKDPYYRFGKLILRFDRDTYLGSYASKYDWSGNLVSSFTAINTNIVKAAPGELWAWAGGAVAVAIDWKRDRATTAGITPGSALPADSRIPLSPEEFSLQRLTDAGR